MSKSLRIVTGTDNFRELVTTSDVFVDKTLFIKEIIDSGDKAILITRPRRWGKTLSLDMLKTFFQIEVDEQGNRVKENSNRKLFERLKISNSTTRIKNPDTSETQEIDIIQSYQGQYPVIMISFKEVRALSFKEARKLLEENIQTLFENYQYLGNSTSLSQVAKEKFQDCMYGTFSRVSLQNSLKFLSKLLQQHHSRKVYIFVDEYDKPVNYFLETSLTENEGERTNVAKLVESMLSACGKGNDYLEKIILTGIFDTLKKEGNSGFNNVSVYGITDEHFSRSFGFTENEVQELLAIDGLVTNKIAAYENIKSWYNGYTIPVWEDVEIQSYTPWAVMKYLETAHHGKLAPKSYWTESGTSMLLEHVLNDGTSSNILRHKIKLLLSGQSVPFDFKASTSLMRKYVSVERIAVYLWISGGYLTIYAQNGRWLFKIPNQELHEEFKEVVQGELKSSISQSHKDLLTEFLVVIDAREAAEVFSSIVARDNYKLQLVLRRDTQIACKDKSYNLDFLQLAALSGDAKIFNTTLSYCGREHLKTKDKYGFTAFDYSVISGNHNAEIQIGAHFSEHSSLIKGTAWLQYLYCFGSSFGTTAVMSLPMIGVLSVLGKVGCDKVITKVGDYNTRFVPMNNFLELTKPYNWLIAGVTSTMVVVTIKDIFKVYNKAFCSEYMDYYSVSSDGPITSLPQMVKYKTTHEKAIVLLGENCPSEARKITEVDVPAFQQMKVPELSYKVSLCEFDYAVSLIGEENEL